MRHWDCDTKVFKITVYYTFIATKNIKEYIIDTCDVMHQNIISQEDTREGDSVTLEEKYSSSM